MKNVTSENVKVGMGLKTWFGAHTVAKIIPYNGPLDFVLNILVFSNGSKMSNTKTGSYKLAYDSNITTYYN